jgi:molybdopterin-biosynthesis enzyme MoeA-like protein
VSARFDSAIKVTGRVHEYPGVTKIKRKITAKKYLILIAGEFMSIEVNYIVFNTVPTELYQLSPSKIHQIQKYKFAHKFLNHNTIYFFNEPEAKISVLISTCF